jgi:hypothetical protein
MSGMSNMRPAGRMSCVALMKTQMRTIWPSGDPRFDMPVILCVSSELTRVLEFVCGQFATVTCGYCTLMSYLLVFVVTIYSHVTELLCVFVCTLTFHSIYIHIYIL